MTMRNVLFGVVIFLISMPLFADDKDAADTFFRQLRINPTSVKLVSYKEIRQDNFEVILSFEILPLTSCEEEYAGLYYNSATLDYTVVYSVKSGDRCKQFAVSRIVDHKINVTFPEREPQRYHFNLNGKRFVVTKKGADLTLEEVALPQADK